MKPAPLLGMLSLFALLCVGLIGGLHSVGSGSLLIANTYSVLGVSSTTVAGGYDPSRQGVEDGGEWAGGPATTTEQTVTTVYTAPTTTQNQDSYTQGTNVQGTYAQAAYTSTSGTYTQSAYTSGAYAEAGYWVNTQPVSVYTATTSPVQPNDSALRILTTTPIPQPVQPAPLPGSVSQPGETNFNTQQNPPREPQEDRPRERISEIGSSLRQFQREVRRVENAVRERVTREVETAVQRADLTSERREEREYARPFNAEDRQRKLQELTSKLSQDVRSAISSGEGPSDAAGELQPVLRSSLEEIRLLIKSDTGVDIDLSPSARTVIDVVAENTPQVAQARSELLERGGLDLYDDTDNDGISNYDERHVYNTDPLNAFTSDSSLTDGERILLGLDAHSKGTVYVPVESPQVAGTVVENVFEVHAINVELLPIAGDAQASDAPATADVPVFKEIVTFSGRALPNSFVTLYVFSTPVVVTVKADASGAWSYTLDSELEDGNHELYVATVDAGGRILAKSPAVPFVKRAEAAEFTPLLIPETPDVTPLSLLRDNLTLVGIVAFAVFALIALIILGVLRSGPKEPTIAV